MKIIQTLSISSSKDPFTASYGWVAPEFHLMSWALSCLLVQRQYGAVTLHANSPAADLLVQKIGLPYTAIHLTHDELILPDEKLWALPKIHTYALQEAPFLHIDGDVFLFAPLPEYITAAALAAQNIEEATEYYTATQRELMQHFTYFPACVKADFEREAPIRAVNAGILGGSDTDFFKTYAAAAFEYIDKNKSKLHLINADRFNVFFEQHLFYSMAKEQDATVRVLFNDLFNDRGYKNMGNFQETPFNQTYLHLLGHFKRDRWTCIQMAYKLRELFPTYYYRIIALFRQQNLPLFIDVYGAVGNNQQMEGLQLFAAQSISFYTAYCRGDVAVTNAEPVLLPATETAFCESLWSLHNIIPDSAVLLPDITADFAAFSHVLGDFTQRVRLQFNPQHLYGRDMAAVSWYQQLFGDETSITNHTIVSCSECTVIESAFDWAGLYNKVTRVGVQYYEELETAQGLFYNLVVAEVTTEGVALFDIDEMEKTVLELAVRPLTINQLLEQMEAYADDEVLQNHRQVFNDFVISIIRKLVTQKVVRPL